MLREAWAREANEREFEDLKKQLEASFAEGKFGNQEWQDLVLDFTKLAFRIGKDKEALEALNLYTNLDRLLSASNLQYSPALDEVMHSIHRKGYIPRMPQELEQKLFDALNQPQSPLHAWGGMPTLLWTLSQRMQTLPDQISAQKVVENDGGLQVLLHTVESARSHKQRDGYDFDDIYDEARVREFFDGEDYNGWQAYLESELWNNGGLEESDEWVIYYDLDIQFSKSFPLYDTSHLDYYDTRGEMRIRDEWERSVKEDFAAAWRQVETFADTFDIVHKEFKELHGFEQEDEDSVEIVYEAQIQIRIAEPLDREKDQVEQKPDEYGEEMMPLGEALKLAAHNPSQQIFYDFSLFRDDLTYNPQGSVERVAVTATHYQIKQVYSSKDREVILKWIEELKP